MNEEKPSDKVEPFTPEDLGSSKTNPSHQDETAALLQEDEKKTDRFKMILDVPVNLSVELGRTKILINDLLQLGQGSVIELDKLAGEAMEIFINDKLVALGEVVVVNEKFGVRLTDIISEFSSSYAPEQEEVYE